jgi:transposase-like protein
MRVFKLTCPACHEEVKLVALKFNGDIVVEWRCDDCSRTGRNRITYTEVFKGDKPN